MENSNKCFVFVSYSRKDAPVATAIQSFLESYRIPRKLVGKGVVLPQGKYIRKVFVDTMDLGTATLDFREELKARLAEAEYLLVICSKNSAAAESFVHREIRHFLLTHNDDHSKIIPVILDGVSSDAVPVELASVFVTRNVVAINRKWLEMHDSRHKAQLQNAYFHVIEYLLKVDANILNNRYWLHFRRKLVTFSMTGFSVLLVLLIMLAYSLQQQKRRTEFEKKVFPLSIDHSYAQAFAVPLFSICTNSECILIAAMPKNYAELGNRPGPKLEAVVSDLNSLGWKCVSRKYEVPGRRSINTHELLKNGQGLPGKKIYLDVVSQLSAVRKVLEYLTSNAKYYPPSEREELSSYYVKEFEDILPRMLEAELGPRGTNVYYVTEKKDLEMVLRKIEGR